MSTMTMLGLWSPDWTPSRLRRMDPTLPESTITAVTGAAGRTPRSVVEIAWKLQVERQTLWKWSTARVADLEAGRDPDINPVAIPAWIPDEHPGQRGHVWYAGAVWWWGYQVKHLLYPDLTPVTPKPPGWTPLDGWTAPPDL